MVHQVLWLNACPAASWQTSGTGEAYTVDVGEHNLARFQACFQSMHHIYVQRGTSLYPLFFEVTQTAR